MKALAGRLMDRACVDRALRLKDQIGLVDDEQTREEFAKFVAGTVGDAKDGASFEAFKARWSRPRNGIVLTAHPTFGLSEALTERIAAIAVAGAAANEPIGLPHRPDAPLTLDYEHRAASRAIRNLRDALPISSAVLRDRRQRLRRPGLHALAQARDIRLVGRLRSRRAHGHQVDLLVPDPAAREAGRAQRHPRPLPRA